MKSHVLTLSAGVLLATAASAAPIKLYPEGNGIAPGSSGKATIEAWLDDQIDFYNLTHTDLPTGPLEKYRNEKPAVDGDNKDVIGDETFTVSGLLGYQYIVFHWGGPANGKDKEEKPKEDKKVTTAKVDTPVPPAYEAYYLDGVSEFSFSKPGKHGLSWIGLYGWEEHKVADVSSTLGLSALALAGLVALRRRK
ncbi:MAG: hypothetical protein SFV32_14470 [Opitutaceae bacterium]|nr:hypothetical protein [Opitutaceae bacterium]